MQDKFEMFQNRLLKVFRHLSKQARRQNISCYRLYDRDLPEFPLIIEMYDGHVYVAEYQSSHGLTEAEHEDWLDKSCEAISKVLQINDGKIFLKQRKRKTDRQGQYQKISTDQNEFEIEENSLKFIVNLSDYLDTGLFLDHRLTRMMVKEKSDGKRVLNLFCYTGSFSVYGAAGGAEEVVSVDLSNTYLDWAKRNMALNGFDDLHRYHFVKADVLQYLPQLPSNHFDLVVLDPPTFSNSKMMKEFLDIQRDHVELINTVLSKMKTGALLYFSTNYRRFKIESELINTSTITDITKQTTPFDFTGKLQRYCYLLVK